MYGQQAWAQVARMSNSARRRELFFRGQLKRKQEQKIAACRFYDQAKEHSEDRYQPVVVMRENHGKALAIVDFNIYYT